jgi:hypothetical protein
MKLVLTLFSIALSLTISAQHQVFSLMERNDLRLQEIEAIANRHFDTAGTGRGTGYKQFQRWLYERRFHTDENGFYIHPTVEWNNYLAAKANRIESTTAGNWVPLGPSSWTYTSGWNPGVGRLSALAVHPANENIIYAGSPGGGLWKTINGGTTWTPLTDGNATWMSIFALTIDPNNQDVVYMGTSTGLCLKSTNGGTSFSPTGSGPTGTIRKVLVHPTNTNIVFACASNGIFRSTNGGTNWTQVHTSPKEDIEFKPDDPNIMISSGTNVARSVDGGITWVILTSAEGITNTGRTLVSVSPADPNVVYAVQANGSSFGRMYRSTNAGASFTTTVVGSSATGTNYFGYEASGTGTGGQATYDMAMDVSPINANDVYIAGIICWRSTNGGTSFSALTVWSYPNATGYNHADVHGLFWVNSNIYSISDGGVYKSSDNGDNWVDLSSGLSIRQFYRIALSQTNPMVITGGAQDNGSVTRQDAGNWADWLGADGMEGLVSPTNHLKIWGTTQGGSLYRSVNGGNTYSGLSEPGTGNWVTPLLIHPSDENILYGGWNGVYKSTTGGTSWTNISLGTISSLLVDLAISPSNPTTIYASIGSTLYVTNNDGGTWAVRSAPSTINDICVDPTNPDKIWIACNSSSNRVLVSTNGGASFTNISSDLPSIVARTVVVDNNTPRGIYVGMNIGVFYKDEIATSWTDYSDNLPMVAINELEIQQNTGMIRVATYGRGVWESPLAAAAPGFTFNNPPPASSTCPAPNTMSITLGTNALSGFSSPIGLSATGVPAGTTVSFSANPVTPGNTTDVTLNGTDNLSAGTYVITITGTATGAVSQARDLSFTINAGAGPTITAQPGSQSTCVGQNTSFTVGASGATSYLWQLSADGCNTWTNLSNNSTYSGVTSSTLNISNVTAGMHNNGYRVVVTGQCGSSTSSPCATLTVGSAPTITSQPSGSTTCAGSSVTLCVTATGSGLTYQWESSPNCSSPFTQIAGATSSCLAVTPISTTSYRVRVTAGACSFVDSDCVTVTVNALPSISQQPAAVSICEGDNASFTVAATGNGLNYQWQVSSNGGGSYSDIAGATTATLNLNALTGASNGNLYRAKLTTPGCPAVNSNGALLTVHALPSVTLTVTGNNSLLPGQQATITANPVSTGSTVTTQWFYNNSVLANTGNVYVADIEHLGAYHATITETWADGSVCSNTSATVNIDAMASTKLFIFPNPNDGRFSVSYYNSAAASSNRTVTIYDSKGSTVYQQKFTITGPYTILDIDITPAMRGAYMVMVSDAGGNKLAEGKLVVQ